MYGRDRWKLNNEAWANAIIRLIFGYIAIAIIFGTVPAEYRWAAFGFMLLLDFSAMAIGTIIQVQFSNHSRKLWMDHLADRIFYRMMFDEIRSGNRNIDVDGLFKEASKEASDDIVSHDRFDNLIRHIHPQWLSRVVGVAGNIFGWVIVTIIMYGSAALIAQVLGPHR